MFSLRRILCTNGNVSPSLSLSLFDSKILPILTYGSIIWNISTTNNVILDGLPESEQTARAEIQDVYNHIFNEQPPENISIQRVGRRRDNNENRPVLIKFKYNREKSQFLHYLNIHRNELELRYRTFFEDKYIKDTDIECLHYKFCKFSLNLPKESSTSIALAELGRFPITIYIWTQMVKYLMRFQKGTNNPILDDAFQCAKANETRWYQTIQTLLQINGLGYALEIPNTIDREKFPELFKRRCTDIYYQTTMSKLKKSPKFNYYYNMVFKQNDKNTYKYQPYLDKIKNVEHRATYTRLRCSAHMLEEEKGRQLNLDRSDRICKQCVKPEIENITHFLMRCNKFKNERKILIDILLTESYPKGLLNFSDELKCFKLLNMDIQEKLVNKCATQIHHMYKKRRKAGN